MMNIKIVDPIPENEVIVTIPFGSHVYGTNTVKSDKDFVKIIKQDTGNLILQYVHKPNQYSLVLNDGRGQVDYIYVSEESFWKQCVDGSNVVFFEALHTKEFQEYYPKRWPTGDYMGFLIGHAYNSRNTKAMLGMAKRDLHYPERYHHVTRCIWMAEKIIAKELIDLKEVAQLPQTLTDNKLAIADKIAKLRLGLKYT